MLKINDGTIPQIVDLVLDENQNYSWCPVPKMRRRWVKKAVKRRIKELIFQNTFSTENSLNEQSVSPSAS